MRILPSLAGIFLASVAQAEPIKVVTDIPAVHSLVSRIGGPLTEVTLLADGSSDLHHMQLRPSQSRELANADLIVWIGPELTPWLDRAIAALAPDTPHLPLAGTEPDDHAESHDHVHAHDPHIWLDPVLMAGKLGEIGSKLAEIDPKHADTYEDSVITVQAELDELSTQIMTQLAAITSVPFIVTHEGYDLFADRFGLTIAGSISDVAANAASARTLAGLSSAVENGEIKCVFGEVLQDRRLPDMLGEKGAKLGGDLDPGGLSLTPGPDLYADLIRGLATTLNDCLSS